MARRPLFPLALPLLLLLVLPALPAPADEVDDAAAAKAVATLLAGDPGGDLTVLWGLSDRLSKGGRPAIAPLRGAVGTATAGARLAIGRALVLLEDYTRGLEILKELTTSPDVDPALKTAALKVIAREGELEEAEWLEDRIDTTHEPHVKMAMAKAIWTLGYSNKGKGKDVLLAYLRSTDEDLRAEGALALGEIGAAAAALPTLAALSEEPTERGRSAAFLLKMLNFEQAAEQALRLTGSPDGDTDPVEPLDPDANDGWPLLDELYNALTQLYFHADRLDREKIEDAMAAGITEALDRHTAYLNPEENTRFREGLDPTYGGVGAYVFNDAKKMDRFTISRPIWGGPIYRAGLRTGDAILEIDGTSTEGLSVDECVRLLKGPPGTDVTITILRPGWMEPKPFTLIRARITIPTTAYDILPGGIGFLEILSFSQDTAQEIAKILDHFDEAGVEGIVIDVRYNGGGYLQSAVEIASQFLPSGTLVVSEKGRAGTWRERTHQSTGDGAGRRQVPVVVLINQATASAAEILAGSLRHWDRARLIGSMSFGKGSVQNPFPLMSRPGETWTDQARDHPISYRDLNKNDRRDADEPVVHRTQPNMRYDPPEKFTDTNGNGRYDEGEAFVDGNLNDRWDDGEDFKDENGNGMRDPGGLLKLTVAAYFLPDGTNLERKTEIVDNKIVVSGGLEPDVEAEPDPLDLWEIQAQRTLDASDELKVYVDGLYRDHRRLVERLARSDRGDVSLYPGFEAFYKSIDTQLSEDAVRFLVRFELRRRIADDLGRKLVGDLVDDPVLQAALVDLFQSMNRKLEDVDDLAFLLESKAADDAEKPKPN